MRLPSQLEGCLPFLTIAAFVVAIWGFHTYQQIGIFGVRLGLIVLSAWGVAILVDGWVKDRFKGLIRNAVIIAVLVWAARTAAPGVIECSSPYVTDYDSCRELYQRASIAPTP